MVEMGTQVAIVWAFASCEHIAMWQYFHSIDLVFAKAWFNIGCIHSVHMACLYYTSVWGPSGDISTCYVSLLGSSHAPKDKGGSSEQFRLVVSLGGTSCDGGEGTENWPLQTKKSLWFVVWNIFYCSIYWECHHPNWLSYFSDGLKPPTRPCWLVMKWGLCYSLLSRMCIQVGIPMINQYFMGWNRSVFKAHVDRIKICLHQ